MSWFPITDPFRERDIRLRRRRALLLVSCIVFVPWLLLGRSPPLRHERHASVGSGDDLGNEVGSIIARLPGIVADLSDTGPLPLPQQDAPQRRIAADTLTIDLRCAASVTLLPDPAHRGWATIYARHGQRSALDVLRTDDGVIAQRTECDGTRGDFIIRLGDTTPLTIVQSGDATMRAGHFTGPVTIDSTGSGSVRLESTGPLTTRQHGSGDVFVRTVNGPVTARLEGSGDLTLQGGSIVALDAISDGSGNLSFGHALIGAGNVSVVLHGSGDFQAGQIEGNVDIETMSSGDARIDRLDTDQATLNGSGSGDISVDRGRIGRLISDRTGSGDLSLHATIDGGTVRHAGSGDLDLPDDSKAEVVDRR